MSLTLHLLKKDLRRSHLLLGFWLFLVAVQYAVMAASLNPAHHAAQVAFGLTSGAGPIVQSLVLAVLVALLVQEEPLAGTTGFWLTRPMPRSSVLRTKAIFGLVLLALPVLAEVTVYLLGGITPHDILLAVPEIVLEQLQVMLPAALLAAVTPNFARFAVVGAVAGVALYLVTLGAQALPNYISPEGIDPNQFSPTLWRSRTITSDLLIALGLGGALIHQYFTRRTARTVAIGAVTELGAVAIGLLWTWNYFPPLPKPAASLQLEPNQIHLQLEDSYVQDRNANNATGRPEKNVSGEIEIDGLPNGYAALPQAIRPKLTLSDGRAIAAEAPAQSNYIFNPPPDVIGLALGKAFVYGDPRGLRKNSPSGLVMLSAETFRQYARQRLTFSGDIDFDVDRLVVTARISLHAGSGTRDGSEQVLVTDVLREGHGVDVIINRRYMNLLFARPSRSAAGDHALFYLDSYAGNKSYVLFNRKTLEAVRTEMNSGIQILSGSRGRPTRLMQEIVQLSFGPSNYALTPELNEAWLADAELIELELQPAATFAGTLRVNDFLLEDSNRPKSPEYEGPYTDPEWLARFVLPPHPTKAQIKQYVNGVVPASQYWVSASRTEIPTAMLSEVGPGNTDVLLDALEQLSSSADYTQTLILTTAIQRAAGPEDKGPVLRALAANPELANLVVKFQWQADCRDTLVAALQDVKRTYLPKSWVLAVADLNDPSTYPALKAFLLRTSYRQSTYNSIRKLPGIDLKGTVDVAWKKAQNGVQSEKADAAAMAIDLGYPDALETLVNVLRQDDPSNPGLIAREATLIKRYTPAVGSNADLVSWYDENRNHLTFDPKKRKFLSGP
jgi:hypothetical protein